MRTVDVQTILRNAQFLLFGKREDPSAQDFPALLGHIDLALAEGWRAEWWPDLMAVEKRYFREIYIPSETAGVALTVDSTEITVDSTEITADMTVFGSGETITSGDEVYWGPTQSYYQAIKNFTENSPATDPADSDGNLNSAYWALLQTSYSGDDYDATVAYAVGDIVYYPLTERFYQCHTATTAGTVPTTNGNFGILNEFDRYVDFDQDDQTPIGDIFDLKTANPRRGFDYDPIEWTTLDNKAWVRENVTCAWVEFRLKRPEIKGDVYDETLAYAVGDYVYWDQNGEIPGNIYKCIMAAAAGETPTDGIGSEWELVEIPKFLEGYLTWSVAARFLAGEQDEQRRALYAGTAEGYLRLETDNIYRQQTQVPNYFVRTY